MSDFDHGGPIELAAAVRAVRRELARAAADGADEAVRFEVGPIEMEFTVELTRESGAKGGVKAWVVSADAESRAGRSTTHRISFTLHPRTAATGAPVEIGDAAPGGTSRFRAGG